MFTYRPHPQKSWRILRSISDQILFHRCKGHLQLDQTFLINNKNHLISKEMLLTVIASSKTSTNNHGQFRDIRTGNCADHLCSFLNSSVSVPSLQGFYLPSFAIPPFSAFEPTMYPMHIIIELSIDPTWSQLTRDIDQEE